MQQLYSLEKQEINQHSAQILYKHTNAPPKLCPYLWI